jgi:hypothetical protein
MQDNSSPKRYTQKMNHNKVLLHKPKLLCCKLSGACLVYCCFKLACDVTYFETYKGRVWDLVGDIHMHNCFWEAPIWTVAPSWASDMRIIRAVGVSWRICGMGCGILNSTACHTSIRTHVPIRAEKFNAIVLDKLKKYFFLVFLPMYLLNTEPLTSSGCHLNAAFHVRRRPMPQ